MGYSGKTMKDKLDELFRKQKEFQDVCNLHPELKDICAALMAEGGELWGKVGGKWWKKHKTSTEEQIEELVDILHFFLTACLALHVSPKELFDSYCKKLDINYKRHKEGY